MQEEVELSSMTFKQSRDADKMSHSIETVPPEPELTNSNEDEAKEEEEAAASRCINERQRQLLVATFGIGLSGLMTFSLIYLLNGIRG